MSVRASRDPSSQNTKYSAIRDAATDAFMIWFRTTGWQPLTVVALNAWHTM